MEKLQQLMAAEHNMSRSAFAEKLEIQPATISHILSGRNKPSFELLKKILHAFPNVRPEWLLFDDDREMLRDKTLPPSGRTAAPESKTKPSSPGQQVKPAAEDSIQGDFFVQPPSPSNRPAEQSGLSRTDNTQALGIEIPTHPTTGAGVERIVVFYTDKTFDSFTPKR